MHYGTPQSLGLGGAQCEAAVANTARNSGQSLLGGDNHHGKRKQRQSQGSPDQRRTAKGGRRQGFPVKHFIDTAAQKVNKKSQTKNPEHYRCYARKVILGDTYQLSYRALFGVLTQIT